MKFDVKDVKSWANRHDVKAGDVGYVTCDFNTFLLTTKVALVTKATVKDIDDNDSRCFLAQPLDGKVVFHYGFFLPVDAVKEDKPKKKYRPLKKIKDFHDCGVIKGEDDCLIDSVLTLRDKKNYNLTRDMKVIDVEYDFDTVIRINGYSLAYLFTYFDIYINDEWLPFGIEVEDNE
nr:MAG TPA: hypothetical protein [Caudoviricetes sp.]